MAASRRIPMAPFRLPVRAPATVAARQSYPRRRGTAIDQGLWAQVVRQARCADSGLDADQWFPVSAEPESARREAAAAIAVCTDCRVRAQCLVLSLRNWSIGQYGVWGGLTPAERAGLRRHVLTNSRMLANMSSHQWVGSRKTPPATRTAGIPSDSSP